MREWTKRDEVALTLLTAIVAKTPYKQKGSAEVKEAVVRGAYAYADIMLDLREMD